MESQSKHRDNLCNGADASASIGFANGNIAMAYFTNMVLLGYSEISKTL
jgi:hypothetical protein